MDGNSSLNTSDTKAEIFTSAEDIVLKTLYVLVSLIDIAGNSVVFYIIYKNKRIQNTVNLLLLNLSFSDIIAGIGVYPYLFINVSDSKDSKSANLLCGLKDGLPLFFAATLVNFLTLGILSYSRYILINHPTKHKWRINKHNIKWIAIGTWITGISVLIPNFFSYEYIQEVGICKGYWPKGVSKTAFFAVTVLIPVVPLVSLMFTYVSTIYTLWFKASTRRLTRSNSVSGVQASRKKVTALLGVLILAFLICWVPFSGLWILSAATQYFPNTTEGDILKQKAVRYMILIAFVNTCLDPVIYAFGNRQIKEGARKTLKTRRTTNVEPSATSFE
ncbi:QRFP-like peptide receptor [Rhopilema esculentum]|uniref:QRFP-like peptide receptor n=1 Tax=Rhopilema esculentum TaxID=499914 RepID=UPI0031E31E08|eukprot:gene9184-16857_t